jgi:hypothetical protein
MQTTFNAEYLIYETAGDCDPVEIIVKGYADIEVRKAESVEIIRNACKTYKVAGDEVRVTLTITKSSVDHNRDSQRAAKVIEYYRGRTGISGAVAAFQITNNSYQINSNGGFGRWLRFNPRLSSRAARVICYLKSRLSLSCCDTDCCSCFEKL